MKINFDFRDLSRSDQVKAIQNVIDKEGVGFLAFLIAVGEYDIYGWFNLDKSNEGVKYWGNLKKEIYKED